MTESNPKRSAIQSKFEHIPGMNCFVCAPERLNARGLHLVFEEIAEGARTQFRPSKVFQSYPGFLHGGILCAILDETMAYAGVFKKHVLPFTKHLEVRFRSAVAAQEVYFCESALTEDRGQAFLADAKILDSSGRALVSAKGEFIVPTWEMTKRMMPGVALEGFEDFFSR